MELVLTNLVIGPLFFLVSFALYRWPPAKINYFYGYRTPRSMRSQRHWKEANQYSGWLGIWVSAVVTFAQLITLYWYSPRAALNVGVGLLLAGLVAVIVLTERRLKSLFPPEA